MGLRPERFPIKWTRLQDWPVRQDIGGHVDFTLGAVDQGNVDVFKILARCVVNDRRGIGATRRREQREEKADRDARACAALHIKADFAAATSAGGLLRVTQSNWIGPRLAQLKAKAAQNVLAVTEVG